MVETTKQIKLKGLLRVYENGFVENWGKKGYCTSVSNGISAFYPDMQILGETLR